MKLLVCTQAVDKNHPILGSFHPWFLEFAKHFNEVHIICLLQGEHTLPDNVYIYSLGKEDGESSVKYVWRFYRYFTHIFCTVHVDFVFFHQGAIYNILAAPFFLIRKFYKTEFYWWKAHGHIDTVGRVAAVFVDKIFTSTATGFPIDTPKRTIIGQAIDTNLFTYSGAPRKNLIVFVGRIMPVKKLELFLETYVFLKAKGFDIAIEIVGPVDDDVYYQKLLGYMQQHNISHDVFKGSYTQKELVLLYQRAKFFLNTSVTHSMDKTVLEAMLCGCIPLTGNKAFAETLGPQNLYIENATAEDYSNRIADTLHEDENKLGEILRERVVTTHSVSTLTSRIFDRTNV